MKLRIRPVLILAVLALAGVLRADVSVGTWWWDGRRVSDPADAAKRLDFLTGQGVTEIYLCLPDDVPHADITRFIRDAKAKGVRVAYLSGDVSWINPGNLGFDEAFAAYRRYQRDAPADARFYAIHLDVEPHQNAKLADERKWQLYADFVLRATARARRAGEPIEWDIPFWFDNIRVWRGEQADASLLELVMDLSDCVTLMSYRDTAAAMLDVSRLEIDLAKTRRCRVVLGAETGRTGEGDFVSYYEEGKAAMTAELGKVKTALAAAALPAGAGVAVHHVGSWMNLKD